MPQREGDRRPDVRSTDFRIYKVMLTIQYVIYTLHIVYWRLHMRRTFRYAILVPLSVLAFYLLFVLPDVDLGWPGGLALLGCSWLGWGLLWATVRGRGTSPGQKGELPPASPGEEGAWLGVWFTPGTLLYYALRAS